MEAREERLRRLEEARREVRRVTGEMVKLAGERLGLIDEIQRIKAEFGLQVEDPGVERQLRDLVLAECRVSGVDQTFGLRLLNLLLAESVKKQKDAGKKAEVSRAEFSPVAMMRKAVELERGGRRVVHLEVGEPDFLAPNEVIDTVNSALKQGRYRYTLAPGLHVVRETIANKAKGTYGIDVTADNVIVTVGGRFSIFLAMMTLLSMGDEVIIFDPSWPAYKDCAEYVGARPIVVPTHVDNDWDVNLASVDELINESTKMIVINSPSNPTGKVLDRRTVEHLVTLARPRGITVLSDEVYSDFSFKPYTSILEFPDCKSVYVSSLSKSFGMTGFRLGYSIANKEIIGRMTKLQALALTSVPEFIQLAAVAALENEEAVKRNVQLMRERFRFALDTLRGLPLYAPEPDGGLYLFPRIDVEGIDGEHLAMNLLMNQGVAVTPGTGFGDYPRHIRMTISQPEEALREGLGKIGAALS